ncbi:unnamed protein product [Urochloa humidicola]
MGVRKRIERFSAAAAGAGEASSRIHLRPPCHPILLLVLRRGCNSDAARDLHRQFTPPSAVRGEPPPPPLLAGISKALSRSFLPCGAGASGGFLWQRRRSSGCRQSRHRRITSASAAVVDGACQIKSPRRPSHPCLLPRSSPSPPSAAALRVTKGGFGTALASARFRLLGCYKEDNDPRDLSDGTLVKLINFCTPTCLLFPFVRRSAPYPQLMAVFIHCNLWG